MKGTVISIIIAGVIIVGAIFLVNRGSSSSTASQIEQNNVSVVDGKQIIKIQARGGYQPRRSVAKAGIPTVIEFDTNGSFDCSSSVRIPSMNISKLLPQTGATNIDLGSPQASTILGSCGMGMYRFEIEFKG